MNFKIPPALKHHKFALLWFGLVISQAGTQMQLWALFWHISTLSKEPIAVGIVGAVRFLPVVLFSLLAGLIADRYSRRRIVFLSQVVAMLVALTFGFLTLTHQIALWHIYTLIAIQAAAMTFELPARQSLISSMMPVKDVSSAFSLQCIAFNMGAIWGPGLSGLVIAYYGQEYTYFFNALSFVALIVALILIGHIPQPAPQNTLSLKIALRDVRTGIQYIRKQPMILSTMMLDFIATFFASANSLLPYMAHNILHVDTIVYGWLAAAQSMGAVIAGTVISQFDNLHRKGSILVVSILVFGVTTVIFGFSSWIQISFAALICIGAADTVSTVIQTVRMLQTPNAIRGRMTGIYQIFFMGGPQLGEIEAGVIAQFFGVPFAIISGGISTVLCAWLVVRKWPQLHQHYDPQKTQPLVSQAES
jgi:MFS family permease